MSGSRPALRFRQGAALTLVFGAVVAAGAATGSWAPAGSALADAAGRRVGRTAPAGDLALLSPSQARGWVRMRHDPWTVFYSPEQYAGLSQTLSGAYVGVGLWVVRAADGTIAVARVRPGTPAARAGILAGERLLDIDGRAVAGLPVTEVVALLRGAGVPTGPGAPIAAGAPVKERSAPGGGSGAGADDADGTGAVGSPVVLTVAGPGRDVRRVTVRRRLLAAQDVTVDHPAAGVTRIAVQEFSQGSGDEIRAAVQQAAADDPRGGLLLDLRGCAGGLLAEAVEAASAFLDGGPVGALHSGGGTVALTAAAGGNTGAPLVVLIDSGTMSAAELLAGALQDRGRAVLVGSATFGKGSVQAPVTLADGSVVERTVAHYTTPSGRSPQGSGVQPDVAVPLDASRAAAERAALDVLRGLGAEQDAETGDRVPQ